MNEQDWVDTFVRPRNRCPEPAHGPGDDAALFVTPAGCKGVISVDSLVSGQHFEVDWLSDWHPPGVLATRLLRGSLSDITAMGARASGVLLSLETPQLPGYFGEHFWQRFDEESDLHGVELLGGNVTRNCESLSIHATVIGHVQEGREWRRDSALPGHWIGVSGAPGAAARSLDLLLTGTDVPKGDPWRAPKSRQHFAMALQEALASNASAIDISDGLQIDLGRICKASQLCATIDLDGLLNPHSGPTPNQVLGGGEDYELLLGIDPGEVATVEQVARETGTPWQWIGRFEPTTGDDIGIQWQWGGDHFCPDTDGQGWDPFRN